MSHDDLILLQNLAAECGITVEALAEYAVRKYLAEVGRSLSRD